MLAARSGCSRTLIRMGNDDNLMVWGDVEEGEIPDSGNTSIEVVTLNTTVADIGGDVNIDGARVVGGSSGKPRVWTMKDLLHQYPGYCGYVNSGLSNLAWANAVKNKPLNEGLGMDYEPRESDKIVTEDSGDEKEEGELEEGEIDLVDSASDENLVARVEEVTESVFLTSVNEVDDDRILKERDLENKVKLIRGVLESTSLVEAQTAFEGVCSKLLGALESLRELVSDNDDFPKRDTLVQLSFASLQTINSVFCSLDNISKELNKETMSRLLTLVNDHFSRFLSSYQKNEIEAMNQNLRRSAIALYAGTSSEENVTRMTLTSNGDSFLVKKQSSEGTHRGASYVRSRFPMLPLLDLHKDHDADSLPSPTRETTPSLPVNVRHTMVKPGFPVGRESQTSEGAKVYPYESDALKAVSTYQKKFGLNSVFKTDDLPSPTPSGEPNDGNGDIGGEVSSSVVRGTNPGTLLIYGQDVPLPSNFSSRSMPVANAVSSTVPPHHLSVHAISAPTGATQTVLAVDQTVKPAAKSRDPRLRLAKPDVANVTINSYSSGDARNLSKVELSAELVNPRKQKAADELFIDGPAWKRQKSDMDAPKAAGVGGWLEDTESSELPKVHTKPRLIENGVTSMTTSVMPTSAVSVSQKVPTASIDAASLQSLLKDIAVNPTMLLNLLKMGERQKVPEKALQKPMDPRRAAQLPGSSGPSGVSTPSSVSASNALAANSSKPGVIQDSSQNSPSDESGSIRMKPRDPRRILHGSTLQRTDSLVEKQSKVNESSTMGTFTIKGKKEDLETPSQLVPRQNISQNGTGKMKISGGKTPDFSTQFTKNLKNIADMVVVSQQVGNPPETTQSVELKTERDVKHNPSNPNGQEEGVTVSPTSVTAAAGPTLSMNSWGDVEHLFEGYDDMERVAIQRERVRRLEEQKKMFASQKLSLVLDIDHTLLNSAKFNEVESRHEEILRKKEEQDREKPHRHLFRFPHMGMWTKLRPGIWNFLEKASKLYELHLYTMGNTLYATEMAKLLDPKGVLFNGRVISKGDDGDPIDGDERGPKSKDLEGVMGMESSVVIIDDSVRVWPHNKMNLIAVERYLYFPCSRRQFGLLGPSLLELDRDEVPEEGTLASSLAVIEKIHKSFFSNTSLDEVDVRHILASEQRKILAGCRIVFSRIIPVGEAKPHLHPLWQTAEQFGAVCTTQVDEHVTHVVTNSLGTDKVNWALNRGRFVVHPGWVEASAFLYQRANENLFAINP
ncbi:PREDICTED: RNA polymerase II C-terminal domain phosphatase-like 3 [Camelina sativa]|uniref:protein-serine/threonine phosphatase n=1 Tax=Camelina sativa TaxID=90675 RepID=A0ABM0WDB6_CAMSA|nr:PREDICTED: RNA polymerase II C-terminal domain phosphatase-like 3 [Camelina sativa]